MRDFLEKTKHFISLRFSLLSIFTILFMVTMISLFSIFYFHLNKIVLEAGLLLLDKTSYAILYELDLQLRPIESASQFSANNIREHVINNTRSADMISYMAHLIRRLPLAQGVYWGDQQGNFIYVGKEVDGTFFAEIINRTTNPPTQIRIDLDDQHREIKRTSQAVNYDPRTRPWYIQAINAKRTIWTELYLYAVGEQYFGTTAATPAFDNSGLPIGVFAVDVRLDYLAHYMAAQKIGDHGAAFILDRPGKIIVSPKTLVRLQTVSGRSQRELTPQWLQNALNIYHKSQQSYFQFRTNSIEYLAAVKSIPILSDLGWFVVIVAPAADFTNQIHRVELYLLLTFLTIFLLGILIMSGLVTRVVTPIRKLVKETERIKNFDLSSSQRVFSRIKEVVELSDAIYSMKLSLRSFQKYVPSILVRQLIKTGEDAKIGGERRDLALFFSDINHFTAITEQYDSKELLHQVYDYFETLSHTVIQNEGTIDKYIGDSLMAFWGAPVYVERPSHLAAKTALMAIKRIDEINKKWAEQGRPRFVTRIGLHFGEAIVGSLGSSERLNYTAIGDSVNMANRIVDVNKIYGTAILVSEIVYDQIKNDYVLRLVDQVRLRGKETKTQLYELLAESKETILFDIDQYRIQFDLAFKAYQAQRWQEAIAGFMACLAIYPQDSLAIVFIERCKRFEINPPKPQWDGVWRIYEK